MKKLTLLLLLVFMSVLANAQNYPDFFPQLLLNKEVKVLEKKPESVKYGYDNFYEDKSLKTKYACCDSYNSKYDNLVNRIFTVTKVDMISGYFILTLTDDKETLYFKYEPGYRFKYPFEVIGGLEIPDYYYCHHISKKPSSQDPTKHFFISEKEEGISFFKMKLDEITVYIVDFTFPSKVLSDAKEVYLKLENGAIISGVNPNIKIEPKNEYGNYLYNANITLKSEDIELLKKYKIVEESIGGIKEEVEYGDTHIGVFNCLVTKE
ncbi:hypothetical protein GN157_00045 [Flavobacterium rakeshii]|uniref:Uncharacterized protein n=1 Tax=Flavobacterium rakeshii TaxID=1038845 RepID=A0A6N8HCR3_9FLAO|nr:hypothetical protein [Flavobacterium rakeshii]MUV02087.1 hypothetical protein [Flavobacterium rakeshii]